jgi:DNA-binding CsgD family transcriptional regulator
MDAYWVEFRGILARTLDCLEEELALFDLTGELIHENRALTNRLAHQGAEPLRLKVRELACSVAALAWREDREIRQAVRQVQLANSRVRLRASYLGSIPPGRDAAILIALQPVHSDHVTVQSLGERHRLTHQEARVALLLAERKSNEEIGRVLGISLHTARHHTEHVLAKLGLHSRSEVAALLARE